MAIHRTTFTANKVLDSLRANGDTNRAHSDPEYAQFLLDAFEIKLDPIPEIDPTTCLRPRLPFVPGILEIFEAQKFVQEEYGTDNPIGHIDAHFNFPILIDSTATVDVSRTDGGYSVGVDVPYNSLGGKAAVEVDFKELDQPFSTYVKDANLEVLLTGTDPKGKKIILVKEFHLPYEALEFLHDSVGSAFLDGRALAFAHIPAFLINLLNAYKHKREIEGESSEKSAFLYNSQRVWFNNDFAPQFDEKLSFKIAVKHRDRKDGRLYTADVGIFSDQIPVLYGRSGAVERIVE